MRQVVRHRAASIVLHRDAHRLRPRLALAQRNLAGLDERRRLHGGDDIEHAGTLAVHEVEEAQARVAGPVLRVGRVLDVRQHLLGGNLRPRLLDQRNAAGDVRRRHRGAGQRGVAAGLQRVGRVDQSARGADVGLEAEVSRQAERTEAGDQVAGATPVARPSAQST